MSIEKYNKISYFLCSVDFEEKVGEFRNSEETTMFWSLSFKLMPDEKIIADSTQIKQSGIIKATYSVILTNKRVIFRFDGLGSSLTQSFLFNEILDASPCERLLVKYLRIKTAKKYYFLHTQNPAFWSDRIMDLKNR